jgi:hypothetical protein
MGVRDTLNGQGRIRGSLIPVWLAGDSMFGRLGLISPLGECAGDGYR